jgi:hypothetical protein
MQPALKNTLHCLVDNTLRRHAVVLHRGDAGSMLVAGEERWARYLPERFFGAGHRELTLLGTFRAAQLPAALARWQDVADITVARVDQVSQRLFSPTDWLRVPEWIRMVAPVPATPDGFAGSSARSDLRRIRKNGLTWRISHDPAELATYLRRDYYPYTRLRHGDDAFVLSPRLMRRAFGRGGLLWVEKDGVPLAGLVFEHASSMLRMSTVACVEADERHLRLGALAGVYLYSFEYARDRGFDALDMRGSRPCLGDPLFFVKSKFGGQAQVKPDNAYDLLVRWNQTTPPIQRFLTASPLVCRVGSRLSAVCAAGAASPPLVPGIHGALVAQPGGRFGDWSVLPAAAVDAASVALAARRLQ